MTVRPRSHADEVTQSLTRFVNETVKPTEGWDHPDQAHNVTGPLADAAQLLSRAIELTGSLIDRLDLDDKLTHHHDKLPAALDQIRSHTDDAARHAQETAKSLKHLESALAPLGRRD